MDTGSKPPEEGSSDSKDKPSTSQSEERNSSQFECNICLDTATDAVISYCGHLFCWPCLNTWLETRPRRQVCPVCKAGISRDKVVPLYGRGSSSSTDPRTKHPPRPQAQRPEPETRHRADMPGFNFGGEGGLHMSFGIGAFPFAYFGAIFNHNDGRPAPSPDSPLFRDSQRLSKTFLYIAIFLFVWLIMT